ncbi:MAG: aromatic amino acid lyase, partial [Anaerolineae bacterium]|nr:aromatic amino acid lyase [Anaerolineae bacterium]
SMGCTAGLKLRQVIDNVEHILALELMAAAQGIDFRKDEIGHSARLGKGTKPVYDLIRRNVPFIEHDTVLYEFIEAMRKSVITGEIAHTANEHLSKR